MKKLILLTFLTLTAVFSVSFCYASEISGTYEGWYYANQGQTGLTLTIKDDGSGVFEFYNMPGNSNAKNGKYTISVSNEDGIYRVDGKEWIEQPSGYDFVYLTGTLDGDVYSGNVSGNSWEFVLTKNNENYQAISDSIFENHRYEVFDEALKWDAAQAKCEEMGGHLVTINSEAEQKFIESLLMDKPNKDYLIGLNRKIDEFNTWVTGEAVEYTNWGEPQPDNLGGSQTAGVIVNGIRNGGSSYYIDRFQWDDNSNSSYPYICEWDGWSAANEWSTPELQEAADLGLIPDVLVGKDMTKTISRGEFAAVAVNLFEQMTGGKAVMSSECDFQDISEDENRNYILKAYNINAVQGLSDTEYAPLQPITREQLATMLCRVYKKAEWPEWTLETDDNFTINYSGVEKFADDADISDYAKPSVYFMVKYGVLTGMGNNLFAPKNVSSEQEAMGYANATREQAIVMSMRSYKNLN